MKSEEEPALILVAILILSEVIVVANVDKQVLGIDQEKFEFLLDFFDWWSERKHDVSSTLIVRSAITLFTKMGMVDSLPPEEVQFYMGLSPASSATELLSISVGSSSDSSKFRFVLSGLFRPWKSMKHFIIKKVRR